jgi:outer membrane protein
MDSDRKWLAHRALGWLATGGLAVGLTAPAVRADGVPGAAAGTCDLAACVARAVERSPSRKAVGAAVEAAEAQVEATASQRYPKFKTDGGVQVWDSALELSLGSFPGISIPATKLRDQITWNVNVTVAQPLAGLWTILEASELQRLGVSAATLEAEAETARVALEATEAWIQAALATDLVGVAEAAEAQRASGAARAKVLVEGGVLIPSELTRAELGVTQARQGTAQARRQAQLALARLSQLVGGPVTPASREGGVLVTTGVPELAAAREGALTARPELRKLEQQLAMARQAVAVERTMLAPSVNLVGQAQFVGGSRLQRSEQALVGVSFDWTFWEWGSRYHKLDELRARVREVEARLEQLKEGLVLEVEAAWIAWSSAVEQAGLAAGAEGLAGETLTLTRARFDAGAATTFELEDVEQSVTRARIERRAAEAQAKLARARLARAMGNGVDGIVGEASR